MVLYPPRKPQRLTTFDYASSGYYFVTICVYNRLPLLSEIGTKDDTACLHLYNEGKIVEQQLLRLEEYFPSALVDMHVIMPDHVHAIFALRQIEGTIKPLSQLVGAFKSTASKHLHLMGRKDFRWQRSFYERVIRTDEELHRVRKYIELNPLQWWLKHRQQS